jgi:Insertion element 4 transposase N-terminal
MPRVGQVKPVDDERLTDRIAVGVLTSMFPPALVDEVLEATGRVEKRHRLLPARVMVYFTLAMCLWADEGYEEVARLLVGPGSPAGRHLPWSYLSSLRPPRGQRGAGRVLRVHPLPTSSAPPGHRPGGFFPLNTWPPPSPKPPTRSCTGSTPDGCESIPASSNARCPNGPSNAPNTATQHDRRHHRPTRSSSPAPHGPRPANNNHPHRRRSPTLTKWYCV